MASRWAKKSLGLGWSELQWSSSLLVALVTPGYPCRRQAETRFLRSLTRASSSRGLSKMGLGYRVPGLGNGV